MPPSAPHDPSGVRRRMVAEEVGLSGLTDMGRALIELSGARHIAALQALARATRKAQLASIDLQRAETDFAHQRKRAAAIDRDCRHRWGRTHVFGADIVKAHAAQAQHGACLALAAESMHVHARYGEEAQRHLERARQVCGQADRRRQKLRLWAQRLEEIDNA